MIRVLRRYFKGLVCWLVILCYQLVEFYTNAVLLRYEYPMMIVTRTKDIFMKRLKRNKKMLTEEGSSDQSKSNTLSRSIQLHTNTFLDSVDSSQLSKKTNQLRDELFPEFGQKDQHDQSYDSQIHDINNTDVILQDTSSMLKKQTIQPEDSMNDKLFKLTHNLALTETIDSQTVQINLSPKEADLNSLICDFDEIDREKVTNQYKKLQKKQQKSFYSKSPQDQTSRFRKKQQMYISPLNFNDQNFINEKTLQSPKHRKLPKQIQHNLMENQLKKRNSFETQNINHKMPIYYPIKYSLSNNASEQRFEELEESYKTLQRYKPETYRKHNEHETRPIYENYDYRSRQKVNSYRQNFLPRQNRNANNFQLSRYQNNDFNDYEQQIERKRSTQYHEQKSPYQSPQRYQTNLYQQGYIQEFKVEDQNRMKYQSPKFKDLKEYEHRNTQHQHFQNEYIKRQKPNEKIAKNQYLGKIDDKKSSQIIIEDTPSVSYYQSDLDEKLEKKRRIREKAAQLLSRVRSHQYLTTRLHVPYHHRY